MLSAINYNFIFALYEQMERGGLLNSKELKEIKEFLTRYKNLMEKREKRKNGKK